MGRLEIHGIVLVRKEEPLLRRANVRCVAINLHRVVAPFTVNPLRCGPFTDAPRRVLRRAPRFGTVRPAVVPLCLAPVALARELKE